MEEKKPIEKGPDSESAMQNTQSVEQLPDLSSDFMPSTINPTPLTDNEMEVHHHGNVHKHK